jgi:site-specific DNA-methyltransferase (adenine-specific)
MLNYMNREDIKHSSETDISIPEETIHSLYTMDVIELLELIPDNSIQLIVCDPPYNVNAAQWDNFDNYLEWSKHWLKEVERVLSPSGNFVLFGGLQYQNEVGSGDLLELVHYLRHNSSLRMVNLIIWHYTNGMSAQRFFANRHEQIVWYAKTKKYTFNLDDVRIPYDEETKKAYMRDPRLNPETIEKGKNPTNVWTIGRLNGNAKERVGHPTQKPLELIRRIVKALSSPGDLVLDFFAGSGTTTRVCIDEKRHSVSSDIDPELNHYLEKHIDNAGLLIPKHRIIKPKLGERLHPLL